MRENYAGHCHRLNSIPQNYVEAAGFYVPVFGSRACRQELRPNEVLRVDPIRLINFLKFKFI